MIRVPAGRRAGLAVVLDPSAWPAFDDPRPLVLTEDRWAGRLSAADFAGPVEALARVRVPKHFNHRSPPGPARPRRHPARRPWWTAVRGRRRGRRAGRGGDDAELDRAAPASCAATRATAAPTGRSTPAGPSGRHRLERDTDALRDKVASRTGSLARTFDRVCALLDDRGATSPARS